MAATEHSFPTGFLGSVHADQTWQRDAQSENLRTSRRGAAVGPSGMTVHHVRPVFDTHVDAPAVFHYAVPRAGTECVAHALQLLTEKPRAIELSIDGTGAFDLISRVIVQGEGGRIGGFHALFSAFDQARSFEFRQQFLERGGPCNRVSG